MKLMWYMEKSVEGTIAKAVVFDEEEKDYFLKTGFRITGKYEIKLLEGDDFLPESIEEF